MIFLGAGIVVFATGPLEPAPWWRSITMMFVGLGIAIGLGVAISVGSVFSRWRVYQRWPMGTGEDWYFHQGLIAVTAGALLALGAAAEVRTNTEDGMRGRA